MLVDSHCHVSPVWYEPVETLLFQMDRCGVDHAVLVQLLGQYDNDYQQQCLRRYPGRFASVVGVDHAAEDAASRLEALAAEGASGLRLRPDARSPGDDPLMLWRAAERLGVAVSCVGSTAAFTSAAFAAVLLELPRLPIVLEHLGGIARPDADDSQQLVPDLARFPNLSLKVPGLGQLRRRKPRLPDSGSPFEPADSDLLQETIRRFGARRLMWGSDFPVVSSREGYAGALQFAQAELGSLAGDRLSSVFGGTAAAIFRFSEVARVPKTPRIGPTV